MGRIILMAVAIGFVTGSAIAQQVTVTSPTSREKVLPNIGRWDIKDRDGNIVTTVTTLVLKLVEQMSPDGTITTAWNAQWDQYNATRSNAIGFNINLVLQDGKKISSAIRFPMPRECTPNGAIHEDSRLHPVGYNFLDIAIGFTVEQEGWIMDQYKC